MALPGGGRLLLCTGSGEGNVATEADARYDGFLAGFFSACTVRDWQRYLLLYACLRSFWR